MRIPSVINHINLSKVFCSKTPEEANLPQQKSYLESSGSNVSLCFQRNAPAAFIQHSNSERFANAIMAGKIIRTNFPFLQFPTLNFKNFNLIVRFLLENMQPIAPIVEDSFGDRITISIS